jgi:predicted alpha/beta hydrolase
MKKITINASDGYPLSAMIAKPIELSSQTIIISSATGIKKEFYINFAKFLVNNGYNVLLYDYRGIGESAPEDLKLSEAYMHDWGILDMNAALNYMVEVEKLTNIIWIGHSVGGQLVGFLEKREHIKHIISISAALGYWGYFPFPMKMVVWTLWYVISPVLTKMYGYGTLKKVGWGENLSKNTFLEWRAWCMDKEYYGTFLQEKLHTDKFYDFNVPITAIYLSDDYIANDITAPLMSKFYPNSTFDVLKLQVKSYTSHKVGHSGIFKKKFQNSLWPVLVDIVES